MAAVEAEAVEAAAVEAAAEAEEVVVAVAVNADVEAAAEAADSWAVSDSGRGIFAPLPACNPHCSPPASRDNRQARPSAPLRRETRRNRR